VSRVVPGESEEVKPMHSIFWLIGVIVVILAVLSLVGLA
jgi:hypothetical protein